MGELAELQAKIEAARPTIDEREAERRQLEEALQAFEEELQETERQVLVLEHRIEEHQRRIEDNTLSIQEAEVRQKEIEGQIETVDRAPGDHRRGAGNLRPRCWPKRPKPCRSWRTAWPATARPWTTPPAATSNSSKTTRRSAAICGSCRSSRRTAASASGILAEDRERILARGRGGRSASWASWPSTREEAARPASRLLEDLAAQGTPGNRAGDRMPAACRRRSSALAGRREAARSTCELLEKLQDDYEGYGQGPREILKRHGGEAACHRRPGRPAAGDGRGHRRRWRSCWPRRWMRWWWTAGPPPSIWCEELRAEEIGQASFLCGGGFTAGDPDSSADLPGGRPGQPRSSPGPEPTSRP